MEFSNKKFDNAFSNKKFSIEEKIQINTTMIFEKFYLYEYFIK